MGAIAAIMLLIGGDTGLTGIRNITIIMAAPFALVMVLLCVALAKDLHSDPLVRRDDTSREKVESAIDYGTSRYGEQFHLRVEPRNGSGRMAAQPGGADGG